MTSLFNQTLNSKTNEQQIRVSQADDFNNLIIKCVVNAVFSLTALVGNGLVLGAIWKTPSLHSPSNILLFGLASSDFGVGLIVQPLYVTLQIIEVVTKEYFTSAWTSYRITQAIFVSTTLLTITAVSVDRFLALHLHLKYRAVVTVKRTLIVLFLIWIASVAYGLTVLMDLLHLSFCVTIVCSSLIATSIVYYIIFRIARRHQRRTQFQMQETLNRTRLRKPAVNMFLVFLWLCLFYTPYLSIRIVVNIVRWPFNLVRLTLSWSAVFVYINSSLNPLIYCWRMRYLRRAIRNFARNQLPSVYKWLCEKQLTWWVWRRVTIHLFGIIYFSCE